MPLAMTYTVGIGSFFTIMLSMVFVSNFVLARFLGLCPFIGVTKRTDSAVGMGMAVTFVMTLASAVTWIIYHYVLLPQDVSGFNIFAPIIGRLHRTHQRLEDRKLHPRYCDSCAACRARHEKDRPLPLPGFRHLSRRSSPPTAPCSAWLF